MNLRTLCGAALAVLTGLASAGCQGSEVTSPLTPPAKETTGPVGHQPRVVTLAFAGDMHFQLHLAALLDHPDGALGPIAKSLRRADLAMVNLESAITDAETWDPKELERPARRYWFRTSPAALELLRSAGIDVVTMANNHAADLGAEGFADTLRAVRRSPIPVIGVGPDRDAAFTAYRVTINHTHVAILAADTTPREGSSPLWAAGPHTPGVAAARYPRQRALLDAIRSASARDEVVVVYLHWGVDTHRCPSTAQRRMAQAAAEAGADAIVGSHAHVQQGAGWMGDTYIDYGLGNFLWYHDHRPETGVLQLRVEDGHVVSDDWVPALAGTWGRPRPLHGTERSDAVSQWRHLRGCSGLAARPTPRAPETGSRSGYHASIHRIGPGLQKRMREHQAPGCPMPLSRLRHLRLNYVGFDGADHRGHLVVASSYAHDVVGVFGRLYAAGFPIRRMRLVTDFAGDDDRSMAADNTSGYNCRRVHGTSQWSKHARGAAIDINPVQNPWLVGSSTRPPAGARYARLDRSGHGTQPPGVIGQDSRVVEAFAAIGWEWGGSWAGSPDYQHFSARP